MLSWVSDRKLNLKNFSTYNFTLIKNKFELFNFNRLPVIKEEERYLTEEELASPPKLSKTSIRNKNCNKKKANHKNESKKNFKSLEKLKVSNTFVKIPSLLNINCLMNTDVKQTKQLWNTNFGKRLINGKRPNESKRLTEIKSVKFNNIVKKSNNKARHCQKPKCYSKREFIQKKNAKTYGGVKAGLNQIKKSNINIVSEITVNETPSERTDVIKNTPEICTSEGFSGVSLKDSKEISLTASSVSKNQQILTERVKNILNKYSNEVFCEQCSRSFSDFKELSNHKKQHEIKQEMCIICEKVFSNQNEFMQHLLTHESVDHFSCKKCKKYFPNFEKYKKHCQDFHSTPPNSVNYEKPW